jgi:multidrug efflux pump subunit AcrB
MLIQFNSLLQPLIILITIPLSLIGSVFGLLIFKQPLSFTALLGAVSLIGIVINNAIILVDYINRHRKTGEDHSRSCLLAVEMRTRPIILTTGTTILGLIPLLSSGTLFVPMAVALISGLLVSALLTLMVIPIVYMVLEK